MLAFSVLLAVFLLMLGVAVLGVHICGNEVAMAAQALQGDVVGAVSRISNTFRGGRS